MDNPWVSVVITTYHRKFELIRKSIESVLDQTYHRMELIVVDDNGSADADFYGVREGLRRYESLGRSILYVENRINQGAQISRNRGILCSKGAYVAFLDDDDWWMPEKVAEQAAVLDCDPEIGLVYCKGYHTIVDEAWTVQSRKPYNMSNCFLKEVSFADMLYGDYIGTTSQAMIRRDVFARCGLFDPEQPTRQDYEMWVRLSRQCRCVGVDQFLFEHIQHTREQISKDSRKAFVGIRRVFLKYRKDAGYTSKCHFALVMTKLCCKNKDVRNLIHYGFLTAVYLLMATLTDSTELNYRKSLHLKRIEKNQ